MLNYVNDVKIYANNVLIKIIVKSALMDIFWILLELVFAVWMELRSVRLLLLFYVPPGFIMIVRLIFVERALIVIVKYARQKENVIDATMAIY